MMLMEGRKFIFSSCHLLHGWCSPKYGLLIEKIDTSTCSYHFQYSYQMRITWCE